MPDIYEEFLRSCLGDGANACTVLRDPRWSWEDLLQRASEEAILPTLNFALRRAPCRAAVPSEILDFLSAVETLNGERNRAIFEEIITVARLLNEIGVEPVLLKGAAYLAAGVYGNPAARYLVDIDLLINEEQLQIAVDLLVSNGFEPDAVDRFARFRHHRPPLRRPGSISIEVHHSLGLGRCGELLPTGDVFKLSLPHEMAGVKVRLPCPEHLMTHLIMHSQMQHPYNERIWPPLRAMYDLVLLEQHYGTSINWSGIEQRFRKARQYGLLALHLLQVRDSLGIDLPILVCLTPFIILRRLRRKLLRGIPALRYFDPVYMFSIVLTRRLRVLNKILSTPAGWKYLGAELLKRPVYQRLVADVMEGRGR